MGFADKSSLGDLGASSAEISEITSAKTIAPEPTPVEDSQSTEPEKATPDNQFFKKEDGESEAPAKDDGSAPAKSPTTIQIKANGRIHEVDLSDKARVEQLIKLGLGARQAFTDKDRISKELKARDERIGALEKKAKAFEQLEQVGGDPRELFRIITGGRVRFDDILDQEWQRKQALANATPEQRAKIEMEERMAKLERDSTEKSKAADDRLKEAETLSNEARQAKLHSTLSSEFTKHSFADKVKDPVVAEEMNEILWKMGIDRLEKYAEMHNLDEKDITPSLAKKIFSSIAKTLSGNVDKTVEEKVNKTIQDKKKVAKAQAQASSSREYGVEDESELYKLSPVELFKRIRKGR
jgi:hypothetical protein